jgi:tetratricopeptide (TPR) repeat protein
MNRRIIFVLLLVCFGCAAVGVPHTFNPDKKLRYAQWLFEDQNRPLPAEQLISEAAKIYEKKDDKVGLANAYRVYALFLSSDAVANWGYRKNGFMNKTIVFDERFQKALEYFTKALALYEGSSKMDAMSNVYFNIGDLYYSLNNKDAACRNFELSRENHKRFKKDNPQVKIELPRGFNDFNEFIDAAEREARCSEIEAEEVPNQKNEKR